MSYALAAALQAAVYQHLTTLPQLVGVPVVDAVPKGQAPGTFVLIGTEEVRDLSDASGSGAEHRFGISVISEAAGFNAAKDLAVAISDALNNAPLALGRGRLVGLWFQRATARRRDDGRVRRIDMTFRARVED
jgi:hypothetical protein